jgi:DNA mismatch repair protein MutL
VTDGTAADVATTQQRTLIRVLPPEVASRIAAGEVVERPASVLKELVENAIDAGASTIEIDAEGGGIDLLRVRDDGHGISPEQVADAFERHATSKLRTAHDLFAVGTLGFRGEALAAIVAAADVDLVTRPPDQPSAAVARYRDGRPSDRGNVGAAPGTSVEVRDLFAALPARRAFLRGERAESRALTRAVTSLALAHPQIAFRLTSNGRRTLSTPGGTLLDAVTAVHGPDLAGALIALDYRRESDDAAVTVTGVVAVPSEHRASRNVHLVANGRVTNTGSLAHAVEQAYEGLLPRGRRPVAFLRVNVPMEQVDVNVHPAKAEVRFRHERLVFAAVRQAVLEALGGASAPAAPGLTFSPRSLQEPVSGAAVAPSSPPSIPEQTPRAVIAAATPAEPRLDDAVDASVDVAAQRTLPLRERLPALRPLGQFDRTYLAAEAPDGLYLVDQHAAHERVRYEEVRANRGHSEAVQPLLEAAVVALDPPLIALALELADDLAGLGWEIAETDGAALLVRAVPSLLSDQDPASALAGYLDRLQAEEGAVPDRVIATLACRSAVRAGDRLDVEQQRALLAALERTEQPMTCPHGRPTVLHIDNQAIRRSFGRSAL